MVGTENGKLLSTHRSMAQLFLVAANSDRADSFRAVSVHISGAYMKVVVCLSK